MNIATKISWLVTNSSIGLCQIHYWLHIHIMGRDMNII